jgi:hypothetical protein
MFCYLSVSIQSTLIKSCKHVTSQDEVRSCVQDTATLTKEIAGFSETSAKTYT